MLAIVGSPDGFLGSGASGISEDGVVAQLLIQLQGVLIICAYTAVITYVILKVLNMFTEVRVTNEQEDIGLDMSEHNEQGYSL
jgi:Amt family ammonium transporter